MRMPDSIVERHWGDLKVGPNSGVERAGGVRAGSPGLKSKCLGEGFMLVLSAVETSFFVVSKRPNT
jgi:hypothetical protein